MVHGKGRSGTAGLETTAEHGVARPFGQCRTVLPQETPCLVCTNSIDLESVQLAQMKDEEKQRRRAVGYIRGTDESPAAAIVQLNTGVACLAVQSLVDIVMGFKVKPYIYYDILDMRMLSVEAQRSDRCPVCATGGFFGEGNIHYPIDELGPIDVPHEVSHG